MKDLLFSEDANSSCCLLMARSLPVNSADTLIGGHGLRHGFCTQYLKLCIGPDLPKTAVITPFGLFKFLWMTLGLKGVAQTFQHLMDLVLLDLLFVFLYLYNISGASSSAEEHMSYLCQLFLRLQEHGVIMNPPKCRFGFTAFNFLVSHHVLPKGAVPLPGKVEAVTAFPQPSKIESLQEFLGMVHFSNHVIPRAAHMMRCKKASTRWAGQWERLRILRVPMLVLPTLPC